MLYLNFQITIANVLVLMFIFYTHFSVYKQGMVDGSASKPALRQDTNRLYC